MRRQGDANELMMVTPQNSLQNQQDQKTAAKNDESTNNILTSSEEASEEFKIQLEIENLKTELMTVFVNPKVAKDTFGRILKEDGVFRLLNLFIFLVM